jgi:diguanylate cyclase
MASEAGVGRVPWSPRRPAQSAHGAGRVLGRARASRRVQRERELRDAMTHGQLGLHYQPTVDLVTGTVFGFEALARWDHPVYGLMSADRFIPLAEEVGLLDALGASLLERACNDARHWNDVTGQRVGVAVNFSARQLAAPDLLRRLSEALATSGLDPSLLTIEITETAEVSDETLWLDVLGAVRRRGILVAIDDFGVGYSSLDSLRRLTVDGFKIDRSFVAGLDGEHGDTASMAIVSAMLILADAMGLGVIAEGVETSEQRDRLVALGCRKGQGHLLARPMPADQVVRHLGDGGHHIGRVPPRARDRATSSAISKRGV